MPLFRKSPEPPASHITTINGRPQHLPESSGRMQRRFRLFIECERRLVEDPLASPKSFGRPVGDGQGLESLVATISPLFATEPSLIRWVALRGALAEIFIRVLDPESAAVPVSALEAAMGLGWSTSSDGQSHPDLLEPWRSKLGYGHREAALGIASSTMMRAEHYPRYSEMSVDEVNADPQCRSLSPAVALDIIAWAAVALLRLEIAQQLFSQVPEPDALSNPGWYTEPLFAKSERYWDGSDWTSNCRVADGRNYRETTVPFA